MIEYWLLKDTKNKVVICSDDTVYFGSPKNLNINEFQDNINQGKVPNDLFGLPYSYIHEIKNQDGVPKLSITYNKNSEEEIYSKEVQVKNEIFHTLQEKMTSCVNETKRPSIWKYAKPQILGLLLPMALFLWTLFLAIEIENGFEYEVGEGNKGLGGLILGIAHQGVKNVSFGYSLIFILGLTSFIKRIKSRSTIHYIIKEENNIH